MMAIIVLGAALVVASVVSLSATGGVTLLRVVNFAVLQWFGVRLAKVRQRLLFGDDPRCFRHVRWKVVRWVWPLTGWWSPYRWIVRR